MRNLKIEDKDIFTKEEVQAIIDQVRCQMIIEQTIRVERDIKLCNDFQNSNKHMS